MTFFMSQSKSQSFETWLRPPRCQSTASPATRTSETKVKSLRLCAPCYFPQQKVHGGRHHTLWRGLSREIWVDRSASSECLTRHLVNRRWKSKRPWVASLSCSFLSAAIHLFSTYSVVFLRSYVNLLGVSLIWGQRSRWQQANLASGPHLTLDGCYWIK